MILSIVVIVAVLGCARAQFMLVWNTDGPSTPPAIGPGGLNLNCLDKVSNCKAYGAKGCEAPYDTWAKENCANTCHFCKGPTDPPPPCQDTIDDCDSYSKSVCTDPGYKSWAEDKCRYYCRLCPPSQLAVVDSHTTTISPSACKDQVDCRLYGQKACTGDYAAWAKQNCAAFCGICKGVATPPAACVDTIPNCSNYKKETCSDPNFSLWVDDNCKKYCGKCGGSGPMQPAVTQSPSYPVPPHPGKRHSS